MNIQEIIIGIVILLCMTWITRRTILCFKRIRFRESPCLGCPCGCKTKEINQQYEKNSLFAKKNSKTLADSKNSRTFALAIGKQTIASEK